MGPALIAALGMGGLTALNEMTTGKENQKRDAILKATAYRMAAYDKSINPDKYDVRQPDPLGKGIQSGIGGYKLGSQIENDESVRNFLNAKGSEAGGIGSTMKDYENSPSAQYFKGDEPYSAVEGPSFMDKNPNESAWSRLSNQRQKPGWKLGNDFTW